MENHLLAPLAEKTANYKIKLRPTLTGAITLDVTLRFRTLQPYFLRELGLGHLKVPTTNRSSIK